MATVALGSRSDEGIVEDVKAALGHAFLSAKDEVRRGLDRRRARERRRRAATTLRDELEYQQLMEIAGVDYPDREERFEVVYHLLSVTKNHRFTRQASRPTRRSLCRRVTGVCAGRRLARARSVRHVRRRSSTAIPTCGASLPITAFAAIRSARTSRSPAMWNCAIRRKHKRVVYEPVELAQDFRDFDFMSPWEGAEYILPGDEKAAARGAGRAYAAEGRRDQEMRPPSSSRGARRRGDPAPGLLRVARNDGVAP